MSRAEQGLFLLFEEARRPAAAEIDKLRVRSWLDQWGCLHAAMTSASYQVVPRLLRREVRLRRQPEDVDDCASEQNRSRKGGRWGWGRMQPLTGLSMQHLAAISARDLATYVGRRAEALEDGSRRPPWMERASRTGQGLSRERWGAFGKGARMQLLADHNQNAAAEATS